MQNEQHSLAERVAILEIQMEDLKDIKLKLDQLVNLKSQGMGALWLIGLLIGSGILGLVATLTNFFNKGHL